MAESEAPPQTGSWSHWLGAGAIAICCGEAAYRLASGPERYVQFTTGVITWRFVPKHQDYALLAGLASGFIAAWLGLQLLERRVAGRLGDEGVAWERSLLACSAIPFVLWASGLLLGLPTAPRHMVWLSAAAVVLTCVLMLVATFRHSPHESSIASGYAAGLVMLATSLAALSALIGAFGLNRLHIQATHALIWQGTPTPLVLACGGALAGLAVSLVCWKVGRGTDRRLGLALVYCQILLPLAFLVVMPTPWLQGTFVRYPATRTSGYIPVAVFALVVAAFLDLLRCVRTASRLGQPAIRYLSPLCLAGALLFLKLEPISVALLIPDDYHFGEYLLPWWTLTDAGAIPFRDYVPARGLINYFDGAAATLTFGSTAEGIRGARGLVAALVFIVGFLSMRAWMGVLPAAAAFLVLPIAIPLTQVDILNTAGLIALLLAYRRASPTAWLVLWGLVGLSAFLLAPAQGMVLVMATAPLGAFQAVRAVRHERRRCGKVVGVAAIVGIIAAAITPLGAMLWGALRYGREHSAVAGPAHGIHWAFSAGTFEHLNRWLFEGIRTSWILVGLLAASLLISTWLKNDRRAREEVTLVGVPIALMAFLFIYRAAGRIDAGWVSRLGYASSWMLTLLLPMLLRSAWGPRRWPAIATLTIAAGGLLLPQVGGLLTLEEVGRRGLELEPQPSNLVRGGPKGMPNIGRAGMFHFARIAAIKEELDVLIDPDETYLDLTNRNAHYFYLGRRVPIESGAFYNLPEERQQLRAVRNLEKLDVPVVLAFSDNQVFDIAPASYRAYPIYRYLIWRYVPVGVGNHIYLLKPDRLRRLDDHQDLRIRTSDPLSLLDRVFQVVDLQGLPASWGQSWRSLESNVDRVRSLGPAGTPPSTPGQNDGASSRAADARWTFSPPLSGKDAGILTFDFSCGDGRSGMPLEVSWVGAAGAKDPRSAVRFVSSSTVVVPLDASPRWLLAQEIQALEITGTDPGRCAQPSITAATLWQRRVAASTD